MSSRLLSLGLAGLGLGLLGEAPARAQDATDSPVLEQVTFEEAVSRAIARNPSVGEAAQAILRAEALLSEARSVFLPLAYGNVGTAILDSARGFDGNVVQPRTQTAFSATASYPVLAASRWAFKSQAADRVETALAGLERPLSRYLLELEPELAEGRSWYAGPGAGELVEWRPVLDRAGVRACPHRVAAVYLELAVLVRALEGLATAASLDALPDRASLWAGLFDLRDTLLGSTVDDLRALAA